jgi:hypothetical protein
MMTHNRCASPVIQWTFLKGNNLLSCRIDTKDHGKSYDLRVVPRADVTPLVEHFARCSGALCRHAQIASQLRQTGWVLSEYSATA